MECPQCQAERVLGAKYCGACGRHVQRPGCQHCGADNPPSSKFCHECGRALAGAPASPGNDRTVDRNVVASPDDAEEIKDSAFWESYADRTGIPAAGLIEVAPGPEVRRRESPVEDPNRQPALRRGRERSLHTTLHEDRERRRPMRIIVAAGTILAVSLILLVLSTKSWHAVLGPLRPDIIGAPSGQPTAVPSDQPAVASAPVASAPVPEVIPAPAASAPPVAAPPVAEESRTGETRAPSPQARSSTLDAAAEPSQMPTTPRTSVEHMATFLVERDGPERAIQTARAVASFYPANSGDFTYWQQVIAAIRASTAPKDEPGAAGSAATPGEAIRR